MDQDFLNNTKYKAEKVWKWKSPWIAAILAFINPLGMLYTSIPAFFVYLILWLIIILNWLNRPIWVDLIIGLIFSFYAFNDIKWKNAAIEKWRYGLPGTGMQNPKKLGMKPIYPDK